MARLSRREVFSQFGFFLGTSAFASQLKSSSTNFNTRFDTWEDIRKQFDLDYSYIHMAGLLLASHPTPVRNAIENHRKGFDANPVHYKQSLDGESLARSAAAKYLNTSASQIALTDSTTMGIALLYGGIKVSANQEILTTTHDHQVTHDSIRLRSERDGIKYRKISLHNGSFSAGDSEIVQKLSASITAATRVVAVTYVHSSTGLKLPIRQMADKISDINRSRDDRDRILFCVDGVHGFGIENFDINELGCDFFVAGTHKWIFGPRGTGIVWGRSDAWPHVQQIMPTFSGTSTYGEKMTPGGYHSFEHRWALHEAFNFHLQIGKARVEERIHTLATQMKEGLRKMNHVTLYTPMSENLSAGIVCFDVNGYSPSSVVWRLRQRKIIMSQTPYSPSYARLTPGLLNTPQEVDKTLAEIQAL